MKVIVCFFLMLLFSSCEKQYIEPINKISACGYDDPLNEIDWLNDMVKKAVAGSVHHRGSIWMVNINNMDCFVVDMDLETSHIFHFFDCQGKQAKLKREQVLNIQNKLTDDRLLFSNFKIH